MTKRFAIVDPSKIDSQKLEIELGPEFVESRPIPPTSPGKFIEDFGDVMLQEVLIQPFLGDDGYKSTFGEGTAYPCRIVNKFSKIPKPDGTVVVSKSRIYLNGGVIVTLHDKITFNGASPVILYVDQNYDIEPENAGDIYNTIIYT